ncbi:MAG TPA: hypothetical protein PLC07_01160 [Bacillota bacterium]|nr:hypothetical protein [Bacillota bacterium]
MRKYSIWILLLCICIIIAGCGGGSSSTGGGNNHPTELPGSDDPSLFVLSNGEEAKLTSFGGKKIHTLIACIPMGEKPEANNINGVSTYSYQLTTAASGNVGSSILRESRLASRTAVSSAQSEKDRLLRNQESEILSRGLKQLSKSESYQKSAPSGIKVGTEWNDVYVNDRKVNLICQHISKRAYFFVDRRDVAEMESWMEGYGDAFDVIYNMIHSKFGTENDVDGNGKIIIVFSQELSGGLLGYFYAVDKFSKETFEKSNEGDIIYITTTSKFQGDLIKATMAHEFQHMVYFDEHYNRGTLSTYTWLNEALSQAAEYYSGYLNNHESWIRGFLSGDYYGLSLTHWTHWRGDNYGYGAIFMRYLIDCYGSNITKALCATNKVGIAAVEAATRENFNITFANFARALVMSGTGDSSKAKYQFKSLDLQAIQPKGRGGLISVDPNLDSGVTVQSRLYPYEIEFFSLKPNVETVKLSWDKWIHGVGFALKR